MVKTSKLYSVDARDTVQAAITGAGTAVFTALEGVTTTGINWKYIGLAAIAGAAASLSKRFFKKSVELKPVEKAV